MRIIDRDLKSLLVEKLVGCRMILNIKLLVSFVYEMVQISESV